MSMDPFHEGMEAFTSGRAKSTNPYNGPYYVPLWDSWNDGWEQAARIEARRSRVLRPDESQAGNFPDKVPSGNGDAQ